MATDEISRLTTVDNPYDPFEDFTNWFMFDIDKGYDTCGLVARLYAPKPDESEYEIIRNTEKAIDGFLIADPTNLYVKVKRGEFPQKKAIFKEIWKNIQKTDSVAAP